jgi:membrane associated rhomboid family serine protease
MSSLLAKARANHKSFTSRRRSQQTPANNDDIDEERSDEVLPSTMEAGDTTTMTTTTDTEEESTNNKQSNSSAFSKFIASSPFAAMATPKSSNEAAAAAAAGKSKSRASTTEDYQLHREQVDNDNDDLYDDDEVHFKQNYAPFSSLFCLSQCIILPLMMWQCGVAPFNINPMIGPYPDALNYWGAKNAVLIIDDGETWRLLTPVFLHAGIIHLLGNVLVQIDAGNMWEKEWGSIVWLIVYLGSAIGSSIFSSCFMPDNISVGSSGAVMGLFGAKFSEIFLLCCERGKNRRERSDARSRKHQACMVIGGIAIVMAMSFIPYVDWAAHAGGVLAGFALGLICFSFKFRNWFFKIIWFVVGIGCTAAFFSTLTVYMYNEVEVKDELRYVLHGTMMFLIPVFCH